MEFIIAENCSIKEKFENNKENITDFFNTIINKFNLYTLKKIIITDFDFNNYCNTVKEMSKDIDKNIQITKNGAAIVIKGINKNSEFIQYVFIRGDIFLLFYSQLCSDEIDSEFFNNYKRILEIAKSTVLHEIGHCVYYQTTYTNYDYKESEKQSYNLVLEPELKKYIYAECTTLLSEYFAQRFMYSYCNEQADEYIEDMLAIINDESFEGRVQSLGKIYRLTYWFIFYISYYHTYSSVEPLFYKSIANSKLIDIFKKLDNELRTVYDRFNAGEFDVANLEAIYKEIYNTKYSNYDKV